MNCECNYSYVCEFHQTAIDLELQKTKQAAHNAWVKTCIEQLATSLPFTVLPPYPEDT